MASPPIPPLLEHLANRPFSFYPAIVGIAHNEWLFRKATWSEIVVANRKSGTQIVIPRRFLGDVSLIDDPVLIVGFTRELEYREGRICPMERRVLQMPVAVGDPLAAAPPPRPHTPAPIVGIRVESASRGRVFRVLGGVFALLVLLLILAANWLHLIERPHIDRARRGVSLVPEGR